MPMPPQKHIIESNALGEATGVARDVILVKGAINPDPFTNLNQVKAGSIVQAIICEIDAGSDAAVAAGAPVIFDAFIWYNIGAGQTVPTQLLVGQSDIKNQVFWQEQGCQSANGSNKMSVYRFTLRIPKSYQQINRDDQIQLRYKYIGGTVANTVWKFIYKEYFP